MDHLKIYNEIIDNAKSENRKKLKRENILYQYFEKHHIVPRCLNGSDDKDNLILLTAKEHYLCHRLLIHMYPTNLGVKYAFYRMTFDKKGKHFISSLDYAYARELYHSIPKKSHYERWVEKYGKEEADRKYTNMIFKLKNHIFSDEHRKNLSIRQKGISKQPLTSEHKQKISKANEGRQVSLETRDKISIANSGKICSNETREKISKSLEGNVLSIETKTKISDGNKGKIVSEETKQKMRKPKSAEHKANIAKNHWKHKIKT